MGPTVPVRREGATLRHTGDTVRSHGNLTDIRWQYRAVCAGDPNGSSGTSSLLIPSIRTFIGP
jgi:hypothetical protein